jgi:hypothetical protein
MKKKVLSLLLSVGMMVGLLAGCGGSTTTAEEGNDSADTVAEEGSQPEEASEEQEIAPDGMARSYLTGEWIDADLANQRPVAIMFENTTAALPSYNISKADIIYEFPVEGGITRMMALFQDYSGMDRIGNVRSCRSYFAYTAIAFDAIYVHCGGAIEAYEDVLDPGLVDNLDERLGAKGFFRSSDKSAPHNLYTSSDGLAEGIADKGYATTHSDSYEGYFKFNKDDSSDITLDGEDAAVVVVYQANPKPWFVYNEEDGLYYRNEFGSAQVDTATGEQLAVKNIIIQECTVDAYYDEQNHDRVDIGTTAGGDGIYVSNGKAINITWTCSADGSITHYYDADGNEIKLNQGKTWVEITDLDYNDRNVIYATYSDYEAAN